VPGAFELTYAAKYLQSKKKYDAIIVLGCVIQGDTPHFDYVCSGTTQGIAELNAREGFPPVIFGLLTVNTLQQALDRCGGELGNKGVEGAITAIKMANL
jgi:6,7-dimethyl-8-ribityllumazine synthase